MQERHPASFRSRHRLFVDQPVSLAFEFFEMPFEIRYAKTDVMDSLTALVDEFCHRRVLRQRLQQLEVRIAGADERRLDALRFDDLDVVNGEAEGLVDRGALERTHCDA